MKIPNTLVSPARTSFPQVQIPDPPAKWMHERLVKQIKEFEDKLNHKQEVGGRLIAAAGEGVIQIEDIGYWGPDMIIFYGTNSQGGAVEVLQHYTQLSLTLTALPVPEEREAIRIGFALVQRLKE